jgi:hypothetical protein
LPLLSVPHLTGHTSFLSAKRVSMVSSAAARVVNPPVVVSRSKQVKRRNMMI